MRACFPNNQFQSSTTVSVYGGVEVYNERSFCVKYCSHGYRLRFTSPPLLLQTPWEIRFPQGTQKFQGMREQISLMLQRNAILEITPDTPGFYSNAFMVHKASGGWRPVIDLKQLNHHIDAPHFRMHTISSVLSTVKKRRLHVQNRSAFENKVYQFQVLHFSLNTAPQVFTCLRHRVAAYQISSQKTLSYREVSKFMGSLNWASGLIPLGHLHLRPLQHFHSLGLTNRFSTPQPSDPVVLATLLRSWQNLSFLTSGIPF